MVGSRVVGMSLVTVTNEEQSFHCYTLLCGSDSTAELARTKLGSRVLPFTPSVFLATMGLGTHTPTNGVCLQLQLTRL
jgi:hypothetical protein